MNQNEPKNEANMATEGQLFLNLPQTLLSLPQCASEVKRLQTLIQEVNDILAKIYTTQTISSLPMHLQENASYLLCNKCGRKEWWHEYVNEICNMVQPQGRHCDGILEGKVNVNAESKTKGGLK